MTMFEMAIIFVLGFLSIYFLVNRICSCVENCNVYKTFAEYLKANGSNGDWSKDMNNAINLLNSITKDRGGSI